MTELSPLAWRLRRCLLALERDDVQLAELWSCLLSCEPGLLARDRRTTLRQVIDELTAAGWVIVPTGHTAWASRTAPALPRTVRIAQPGQRAARVRRNHAVGWVPALAWAAELELSPDDRRDLMQINRWLGGTPPATTVVPPRERSLEVFGAGNEHRLDELSRSPLFAADRLSWDTLRSVPVPPPFVWSSVGPASTLLVVAGHETFASVRRALIEAPVAPPVGIVAYGAGRQFSGSVRFAHTLDRPIERILYYGDLDLDGLRTPWRANQVATASGLPIVEPARACYDLLVRHGQPSPTEPPRRDDVRTVVDWLPAPLRHDVGIMLLRGRRLAQEWVGFERLRTARIWESLR